MQQTELQAKVKIQNMIETINSLTSHSDKLYFVASRGEYVASIQTILLDS